MLLLLEMFLGTFLLGGMCRFYSPFSIGDTIKSKEEELSSSEQDILLYAVKIIKQHGGTLGSNMEDMISK